MTINKSDTTSWNEVKIEEKMRLKIAQVSIWHVVRGPNFAVFSAFLISHSDVTSKEASSDDRKQQIKERQGENEEGSKYAKSPMGQTVIFSFEPFSCHFWSNSSSFFIRFHIDNIVYDRFIDWLMVIRLLNCILSDSIHLTSHIEPINRLFNPVYLTNITKQVL